VLATALESRSLTISDRPASLAAEIIPRRKTRRARETVAPNGKPACVVGVGSMHQLRRRVLSPH
jgi:hypothetical protein